MRTIVLIFLALISVECGFSQKKITSAVKPFQMEQRSMITYTETIPADQPPAHEPSGMQNPSTLTPVFIGASRNIFSLLTEEQTCLWYDKALNNIMMTCRGNNYGTIGILATGEDINNFFSSNSGTSWTGKTVLVRSGTTYRHRYPSGVFYNPSGNTNINNAYSVTAGPRTDGASWIATFHGVAKYDLSDTSVTYTPLSMTELVRQGLTSSGNGIFNICGVGYTSDYLSAYLYAHHGTWNSGTNDVDWGITTLNCGTYVYHNPSDNTLIMYFGWSNQAFSKDGTVGYMVLRGSDIRPTLHPSYSPIIFKSTNGGVTWTLLPYFNFGSLPEIQAHILPINTDPNTYLPYFDNIDLIVDAIGCLHIFSEIRGCYSSNPDSLGYVYVSATDGHCIDNNVFEVYQDISSVWHTTWVDSIVTDDVTSTVSPYYSSTGNVGWGHRLQAARKDDGSKVFVTWTETDYQTWATDRYNFDPDLKLWGRDVYSNLNTDVKNITAGDPNLWGLVFFHYTSPVIMDASGTYKIPVTYEDIYTNGLNADLPPYHYFIQGVQVTDADFTQGSSYILVTSPNGNESWTAGSTHNITWNSTGVTNVKIEYTYDNGNNWSTIISSYPASSGTYSWVVPNTPSTQCLIKISEVGNATFYDVSNVTFTITTGGGSTLTVTSPNGYENWQVGTTQNITWTSSGVTNVKIEYTYDNGAAWNTITASYTASSGTYSWLIPNTPSTQCRVRISDVSNPSLTDMSDNLFTISSGSTPTVTVTSPNGYESWQVGSTHNITWTSSGVTNVKIEYTYDNMSSWITIESSYPAGGGSYTWVIPNTPSTQCRVRISDASNLSVNDISDNLFTITAGSTPTVTVTSPNGYESWQAGSTHYITWTSSSVTNVNIDYTYDNGSSWITISNNYPASSGTYTWVVPNTPSTQCRVRITDTGNTSVSDISDNLFTITSGSTPTVTVLSPNGYESWQIGSSHNITWTSSAVTNVKIEYTYDSGISWLTITSSYPASAGSYVWVIPNTPSTQCWVRISDAGNASVSDISDHQFAIVSGTSPTITVLSPNGSESWQAGSSHTITWTSSGVSNVKIEYTYDNAATWILITTGLPSSIGTYTWLVPNTPSTQCRVKISDASNQYVYDMSDDLFTITSGSSATLMVLSPNGGEILQVSATYNIVWNSTGVDNIKIEYTIDNGSSWSEIASNIPTSGNYYPWMVPNTPSGNCKVRITDVLNLNTWDQSNNVFTIVGSGSSAISVIYPNGYENWQAGLSYQVIWNSANVSDVRIDYSTDGGTSWIQVISTTPASSGYYLWMVPSTPSINCKVKITDVSNSTLYDLSDNPFTIFQLPGINEHNNAQITLGQSYPNPADDYCLIPFSVNENSSFRIELISLSGITIKTIINETRSPGNYLIRIDVSDFESGDYYYRMEIITPYATAPVSLTKKLVVIH